MRSFWNRHLNNAWLLALLLAATVPSDSFVKSQYVGGTPHRTVIELGPQSFPEAMKDVANPFWLLKFYAPWCGHCKKMAPVLDKVAPMLAGKMAIGKIDCTVHKSLCSEYKVRGYPTIKYSIDGAVDDYPGGRDEGSIMAFAKKMSAPPVKIVSSQEEALHFAKTQTEEGVAFLGFDPKKKSSSDDNHDDDSDSLLYQVFSKVARKKQASAYFLWLLPPPAGDEGEAAAGTQASTTPFVNRIEADAKPRAWGFKTEEDINDESLAAWVQEHNIPLVATLGPNNFHKIARNGRPLAVSVVDMSNEAQVKAVKDHMLDYILQTGSQKADKYYYGIIDIKRWGKFLEQFRVSPEHTPQIVVMDVPTKEFYQNETYTNMFEFIDAIEDGTLVKEKASAPGGNGFLAKIERMFLANFPYSLIVLLLLVFGIVFLLVPSEEDMRPKYIPEGGDNDDGDGGVLDEPPEEKDSNEPKESKKDK